MRMRTLGFSDIRVSELALGTQRWGGTDFNSPDEATCHQMLDLAAGAGATFLDTAEQYPIPSGQGKPEGSTERIIGSWLAKDSSRREKLVIASKITGGGNVTPKRIEQDLEGTLKRLGTDYLDVYLLHWPARYTPQANWGQSLEYNYAAGKYSPRGTSFAKVAATMGRLVKEGKIRGWGICNDNAYGLMASTMAARELGVAPPCVMQNDYSLLNRRIEENGLSEASAPWNEVSPRLSALLPQPSIRDPPRLLPPLSPPPPFSLWPHPTQDVGFLAYNTLAGGMLTGKYMDVPASIDDTNRARGLANSLRKRGRMDEAGWGRTLYRYRSGPATEATKAYAALASEAGLSLTELSLRWCRSRNAVTSTLLGHSSTAQLAEALEIFASPPTVEFDDDDQIQYYLPESLLWEIDRIHMRNRLPIFASTRTESDWDGRGEIGETIP
jgi:aryl-alcohol dehydrogenase-like predicted oxidoreductase